MPGEESRTTTEATYTLMCADCAFEATVEGGFLDAIEVADEHQESRSEALADQFVNVEPDGHR